MSPEQAMGEPDVDGRADVYGTAVCLYEAVVGDVPFDAPNYNKLLRVILNEQPVPPRARGATIDAQVEAVIMLALAKEREKRPQSAGAMLELLQAATAEQTIPFDRDQVSFGSGPPGVDRTVPSSPAFQYREPPPATAGDGLVIDFQHAPPKKPAPRSDAPAAIAAPASAPGQGLDLPASRASRPMGGQPQSQPKAAADPRASRPIQVPPQVAPSPAGSDVDFDPLSMDLHGGGGLELDEVALASSQRPRAISSRSMSVAPPSGTPSGGTPTTTRTGQHARASMPPDRSSVSGTMAAPIDAAPPPAQPSALRKWAWYVLGGLLLFVAAVFAVRFAVHGVEDDQVIEPTLPDPGQTPVPEKAPTGYVTVDVTGLPPGAQIRLDGLPAAALPLRLLRGSGTHSIEVSAPGYGSRRFDVSADRNQSVSAGLRPMEGMGTRVGP
jgi:serine/threonine-protein kinase